MLSPCILVYTGRIVDPTTWEADFTQVLVDQLAEKIGPALKDFNAGKFNAQMGAMDLAEARPFSAHASPTARNPGLCRMARHQV
jgi:hypothetical protein